MANRRTPAVRQAVLAFLRQHLGQVFCAGCIVAAVNSHAAEIVLREAEGQGARRRHGQCSRCGKLRLVSGLPSSS